VFNFIIIIYTNVGNCFCLPWWKWHNLSTFIKIWWWGYEMRKIYASIEQIQICVILLTIWSQLSVYIRLDFYWKWFIKSISISQYSNSHSSIWFSCTVSTLGEIYSYIWLSYSNETLFEHSAQYSYYDIPPKINLRIACYFLAHELCDCLDNCKKLSSKEMLMYMQLYEFIGHVIVLRSSLQYLSLEIKPLLHV